MFKAKIIGVMYRTVLRPVLFRFDPENIHDLFTSLGENLGKISTGRATIGNLLRFSHPSLMQTVAGIDFRNPVGLAAGFDKDVRLLQILPCVGFGYAEIGTITAGAYVGNPKPRLYRLKQSRGLVVNYGLKNLGIKALLPRLTARTSSFPISVSVGKTNDQATVDIEAGIADYCETLRMLEKADSCDFYTINISCPNAFGGEPFTTPSRLERLMAEITALHLKRVVFVKMPINLPWNHFAELLEILVKYQVEGVIIGNLNKHPDPVLIKDVLPAGYSGGISGKPTWKLSNDLIAETYRKYGDKLTIIGCGGIFSAADAYEKIRLGASLVQLITGMIYQGPQLVGEINAGLVKLLQQDGYENIHEAIGTTHQRIQKL